VSTSREVSRLETLALLRDREHHSANVVLDDSSISSIGACYEQEENQGKNESSEIVTEPLLCVEIAEDLIEC